MDKKVNGASGASKPGIKPRAIASKLCIHCNRVLP